MHRNAFERDQSELLQIERFVYDAGCPLPQLAQQYQSLLHGHALLHVAIRAVSADSCLTDPLVKSSNEDGTALR